MNKCTEALCGTKKDSQRHKLFPCLDILGGNHRTKCCFHSKQTFHSSLSENLLADKKKKKKTLRQKNHVPLQHVECLLLHSTIVKKLKSKQILTSACFVLKISISSLVSHPFLEHNFSFLLFLSMCCLYRPISADILPATLQLLWNPLCCPHCESCDPGLTGRRPNRDVLLITEGYVRITQTQPPSLLHSAPSSACSPYYSVNDFFSSFGITIHKSDTLWAI